MKINLGAGNVKKTSVKEMVEEYKASEGGKLLLNGGKLTVPVTDYVKSNFQIKAVETRAHTYKQGRTWAWASGVTFTY